MKRMLGDRHVDLVLLDINLPGEDGLSLARKLRVTEDVAIIMVTGRNEDIDRIISRASENVGSVTVEIVDGADIRKILDDVKSVVEPFRIAIDSPRMIPIFIK